jgi:hypothetical protein
MGILIEPFNEHVRLDAALTSDQQVGFEFLQAREFLDLVALMSSPSIQFGLENQRMKRNQSQKQRK